MTNLNVMTIDQLFYIIDKLSTLKPVLSQAGLDKLNQHLIEIDAELESRQPVGKFRTLLEVTTRYNPDFGDEKTCSCGHTYYRHFDSYENMLPVGCKYCECAIFSQLTFEPVGFEYLGSTLEGNDNWNQWEDYGLLPSTFMGQY